jgi:hypothetical protein
MTDVLERGDIYFIYRPRVQREPGEVESIEDVQRMYIVLHPEGKQRYRLIVVGRKHLPDIGTRERTWGFVDKVAQRPDEIEQELSRQHYDTRTRGARVTPAGRPVGEGVYAIVAHGEEGKRRHTHLAYALELPREPGEAQEELRISEEGSYVISVKNPEVPSPPRAGLRGERKAEFPRALEQRFRGRRFADVDPPEFLDHEGAEILLVGAEEDVSELGIQLDAQEENRNTADICRDLRGVCSGRPVEPLFRGEWA